MRILGIDYGDKNIGLAVSDPLLLTAQPLGNHRPAGEEENARFFINLVIQYEIGEIVLSFPLRMDGSSGTRAEKTRDFARWLKDTLHLPVILWDERLTTHQAQSIMREQKIKTKDKKNVENQISAAIILDSYLERRRSDLHGPQSP